PGRALEWNLTGYRRHGVALGSHHDLESRSPHRAVARQSVCKRCARCQEGFSKDRGASRTSCIPPQVWHPHSTAEWLNWYIISWELPKTPESNMSLNTFQRASSVARPLPGGEKRRVGGASHHEAWGSDGVVSPPVCTHRVVSDCGVV